MKQLADLVVYSPQEQLQLIVEVKKRKGATDEWATKMRRNLVAHALIPSSLYFLLVLPEYLYLWRPTTSVEPNPADYKISAQEAFKRYLDDTNLEELSEHGFELLVSSWLRDVISSPITKEATPELSWIFDSGLYDSIKGGSVGTESVS